MFAYRCQPEVDWIRCFVLHTITSWALQLPDGRTCSPTQPGHPYHWPIGQGVRSAWATDLSREAERFISESWVHEDPAFPIHAPSETLCRESNNQEDRGHSVVTQSKRTLLILLNSSRKYGYSSLFSEHRGRLITHQLQRCPADH